MKRMFTGLQRRVTSSPSSAQDSPSPTSSGNESPESVISREIKAFCESGGGASSGSNDYLHLPAIVEAAESSANAAKEAAVRIRKYLSSPSKPQGSVQYNSVMLIRILSENPGHTFTRNFDTKFVGTVKELLREGRDMSAQQMLRETLEMFETQKSWDEDLAGLIAMWKKEKERIGKYTRSPPPGQAPPFQQQQPGFPHAAPRRRGGQLPPPDELASRISEAKTSANLLIQLAQSTPAAEVQSHELMREFSQRCQAASRSVQAYMAVENPPPDENTMLTLIETNEQLSVALSKYQRAVLNARKALGTATPVTSPGSNGSPGNVHSPPPGPPPGLLPVNGQTNGNHNAESGILIAELGNPSSSTGNANESQSLPALASLSEPFTLSRFDVPIEVAADVPATTTRAISPVSTQPAASKRYEYNADEFAVENPFADNAADDHDSDHDRHHEPSRRAV